MTAFSRIVPAYFLDDYHIICLRETRDLHLLREKTGILCLEEAGPPVLEQGVNSAWLLAHPLVRGYLKGGSGPKHLFLYQAYPELETLAETEGWTLLANPAFLRMRLVERSFFQEMVTRLGLPGVPGVIRPIDRIHGCDYDHWRKRVGERFVVQLPDVRQGGGRGTFFISSEQEYGRLQERLEEKTWRGLRLSSVCVRPFVEGVPASLALCLTRQGVLFSGVQRQLIDLPYLRGLPEHGVFCGHVWEDSPWPSWVVRQTREQAQVIADYLFTLGYRGIMGIDFLLNGRSRRVHALEINPRLTGVFPMLSLLHLQRGIIPLEAFHMLEFLDVPYRVDVEGLNAQYAGPFKGSHVLLLRGMGGKVSEKAPQAGLYEYGPGGCTFVREGTDYEEVGTERQFVIVDGPPRIRTHGPLDTHDRLCRLLFPSSVLGQEGRFRPWVQEALDWAHRNMVTGEGPS